MDITLILAVVGTLTGVLGAVLGVVNTYWHITSDTIELSVHPNPVLKRDGILTIVPRDVDELGHYLKSGNEPKEIVIHIINKSRTTAFVTDLGFMDRANRKGFGIIPKHKEGKRSTELKPKEPITIPAKITTELRTVLLNGCDKAFAETSNGRLFAGSTPTWDAYIRWLRESTVHSN